MSSKIMRAVCLVAFCTFAFSQSKMVSHVVSPGSGFRTTIHIENSRNTLVTFTLNPYSQDGTPLTSYQGSQPATSSSSFSLSEIFTQADSVSHFEVDAEEGLTLSVSYSFETNGASSATLEASATQASTWRLTHGDWNRDFDGLAVVNSGDVASEVWLHHKNESGLSVRAVRIAERLGPKAKTLTVIGSPAGSPFNPGPHDYFEITATQKLSITALRGTLDPNQAGSLFANEPTPGSTSHTTRDDLGVWFIKDGSFYDIFDAMGYNVAVDRIWQAELLKRTATGRLAEVFGPDFVLQDSQVRIFGYSTEELNGYFDNLHPKTQTMILAYINGMNRRIAEIRDETSLLPFEFKALGFAPEYWTAHDVMRWLSLLQRNFNPKESTGLWQLENVAVLQELSQRFGPLKAAAMFQDLLYLNDPSAPTMVPNDPSKKSKAEKGRSPILRANLPDVRDLAQRDPRPTNMSYTEATAPMRIGRQRDRPEP